MIKPKRRSAISQDIPLEIVGSTKFGRYPKISMEQTFNMIESDGFLVPFAGYLQTNMDSLGTQGRGLYSSTKYNHMIAVFDNDVYTIDTNLEATRINSIETSSGDVIISENNAEEIAICDKQNIYIFNYRTGDFSQAALNFTPSYVTFQDTYFIATVTNPDYSVGAFVGGWQLSDQNDGLSWPHTAQTVGLFQTKADNPIAAVRMPGKGNVLLIFGSNVTEIWVDVGNPLFPYQKNTSYNLDYGCKSAATIAFLENYVVWLGGNETAGPTIMYTDGGDINQISNDGINFRLAHLTAPQNSYGFLFRQDGHLIYMITFYTDNLSLAYDFNTQKFFTLTDENYNYHIAKKVVLFNNEYYFISINDGNLYRMSSLITTYNGNEIPRIRITPPIRLPTSQRFIVNNVNMLIEQGEAANIQRVDLAVSKDSRSFSSYTSKVLNTLGRRQNRLYFWNLGQANDFVMQFRFWSKDRFVVSNGTVSTYQ